MIALAKDVQGVYRIGDTRVTLDLIVRAFHRGATAEEIVQDWPSLQLPDVYQVIGYYLKHRSEFDGYLQTRSRDEDAILEANATEWAPVGLRKRLLARRKTA